MVINIGIESDAFDGNSVFTDYSYEYDVSSDFKVPSLKQTAFIIFM